MLLRRQRLIEVAAERSPEEDPAVTFEPGVSSEMFAVQAALDAKSEIGHREAGAAIQVLGGERLWKTGPTRKQMPRDDGNRPQDASLVLVPERLLFYG